MNASVVLITLLATVSPSASAVLAPAEKTQTATGTVVSVQPPQRTVAVALADGTRAEFRWNADTKINGVLSSGARVTIRYAVADDGGKLALQITVAHT
jgi:hypothetical protein